MITITQNIAINLECIVLSPLGKPVTGLSIDYEVIDCSDESVLTSGTATEATGGYYYFTYTFTAIKEYRLHWISPTNYEDGFEDLNVIVSAIVPSDTWKINSNQCKKDNTFGGLVNSIYNKIIEKQESPPNHYKE